MRIKSLLISVCLLANIGNTVFAQFYNPITIRRGGGGNTISNIGNFGSYVYVTNLGVFSDGGTPITVGGIGGAGGYNVDTSGNLHFYGNSTFTGTNTFSNYPIIGTNYSPSVQRVLLATNVGFFPVITNSYAAQSLMLTNNGLQKLTLLLDVRLPAVGPDERVGWYQIFECTNVNKTALFYQFYCGENTNYITGQNAVSASGTIAGSAGSWIRAINAVPNLLFFNSGSTTNQYISGNFPNTNSWGAGLTPMNLVDTSTNGWRLMLGASGDTSTQTVLSTNLNLVRFIVVAVPNLGQ